MNPVSGIWQKAHASFRLTESRLSYSIALPISSGCCTGLSGAADSRVSVSASMRSIAAVTSAISYNALGDRMVVGQHALCWVHAERLVHKLDAFTDKHRAAQTRVRGLIWGFYASLKAYRDKPSRRLSAALRARFDRIFLRRTGFVTLDRLLARLHANKAELLMVLDRPEIPLHTNGSENDIRCYVTRRKVSAGTRSDVGRDCRDAFLGLAKTCDKLGIAVWDYLGSRLKVVGHMVVQPLDHYVRGRCRPPDQPPAIEGALSVRRNDDADERSHDR